MKIALAQYNFKVADLYNNQKKILQIYAKAQEDQVDILIFSELNLCGYLPEDLLLRADFMEKVASALAFIQTQIGETAVVIGCPRRYGDDLYNCAVVIQHQKEILCYRKQVLPNYGIFDEKRYFREGEQNGIFQLTQDGPKIGLLICEDVWSVGAASRAAQAGAEILISIHASPFAINKEKERNNAYRAACVAAKLPMLLAFGVGVQDEFCFDGGTRALDAEGACVAHTPYFEETTLSIEVTQNDSKKWEIQKQKLPSPPPMIARVYQALLLGIRDYVRKNNFEGVLLGLSGGIDSSLTLLLAIDALGVEHVTPVTMPSRFTSSLTMDAVNEQVKLTNANVLTLSIEAMYQATMETLGGVFGERAPDKTEENIQARCRGMLLMALSNKFNKMVLTTGNKSEMAMGYATLYGDMTGGFAALKDVPKTLVYELARYRNQITYQIPQIIIDRAPTAELAFNQKDEDSLPPYSILDEVLHRLIDLQQSIHEIVASGFDETLVKRVASGLYFNEYKRRQAPPGIKITEVSFTRERRYPITSGRWWDLEPV